jgi:hypothetical protein
MYIRIVNLVRLVSEVNYNAAIKKERSTSRETAESAVAVANCQSPI